MKKKRLYIRRGSCWRLFLNQARAGMCRAPGFLKLLLSGKSVFMCACVCVCVCVSVCVPHAINNYSREI